jgi:dinuclear metal center YbgI/SA1388 family protein
MSYLLKDIIYEIEKVAPKNTAESWDNVGLMVGDYNSNIKRVMFAHDITDKVLNKAINEKVDLIMSHHPFIFKSIKNITNNDEKGRMILKTIKNNINLYSAHTNLDFSDIGINDYLLKKIGINESYNLIDYKYENLYKVVVYVPETYLETVRKTMLKEGAGFIGKYSDCTFGTTGTGTFRPLNGAKPFIGNINKLEEVEEVRLESVIRENNLNNIINKVKKVHPYEEVAYDVYKLENKLPYLGYGKFGYLKDEIKIDDFLKLLKEQLNLKNGRIIKGKKEILKKIAVFTGALDEKIIKKIYNKVDLLITGDIKYHIALDIKNLGFNVIDAGHFYTEIIVKDLLKEIIKDKFENIDIIDNNEETEPFDSF